MLERIKTALILLVIMAVCLFATTNPFPMIALLSIGGILAAHEWSKLIPNLKHPLWFILTVVITNFLTFRYPELSTYFWIFSVPVWLFAAWCVKVYPKKTAVWFSKPVLFYIGFVLIVATISGMFYLWQQSPWWLLYAMALVWCADTGAYFAGRAFGKRKLAPTVSPKKTYEGMVGGLILCMAVMAWVGWVLIDVPDTYMMVFFVLSMLAALISVLGDLLESMVKRKAGVKDSGTLLPGHGGLLDRIDSMMATVPIFALGYMTWLAM